MTITLGSLFDGIGVFPLAASRHGITPVWASEIVPDAISITKRHFPEMVHLGDITKLDGGKIPAVHVITFGSPCQNLSSIGPRDGLTGAKSSLFYTSVFLHLSFIAISYFYFTLYYNSTKTVASNTNYTKRVSP